MKHGQNIKLYASQFPKWMVIIYDELLSFIGVSYDSNIRNNLWKDIV